MRKGVTKKDQTAQLLRRYIQISTLTTLFFMLLFMPGQSVYTATDGGDNSESITIPLILPQPPPLPVNITGVSAPPISANAVVIQDVVSGVYLLKNNEEILLSPASTTKILTAMVALDHFKLEDTLTVPVLDFDGQLMGLIPGEKITVENLLYGLLIQSGNDAAFTISTSYPGGTTEFVAAMNRKAASLHLIQSNFTNPAGFDDPNHQITALDLARLSAAALQNKIIAKMVAIPVITISDVTHTYFHPLTNVNQLLGKVPGVGGLKTGWTEEAGENLVTLVERNNHIVVFVVLGSTDRFTDTQSLIDWVFSNFDWSEVKS
ncbi:hypothetical protein A2154_05265 [Candidatus Gottesmanbacteria bacterium RBG_16_43_7]|uniref:Peptidase S11 D-alanyl-D-alanine carboxypeptidase A N-terminal domain-containing protein n=1 Tax=Candidatus Gottesmanbacteria bacterium RBG_16_43_7 TaxID=1798373 RepID=A0A1F5Z9H1_9BACT|nr:MAG: hypothetical protein A2154_05265 [Candidatus Gottesmanbacteria bacterium RBG_16_43_7]